MVLHRLAEGLPVEWLGSLDETAEFLQGLDLFVLVAEPPGCPNASLEAMACGLPVIATDVGGMREQVVDGVTGRLVGRDDVDGLAAAILEAARDPLARSAWGEAGRRRAEEHFGLDRMIDGYVPGLRSLKDRLPGRPPFDPSSRGRRDRGGQEIPDGRDVDGLGEVAIEAGLSGTIAILVLSVPGDRGQRDVAEAAIRHEAALPPRTRPSPAGRCPGG